ncbi:MAG: radical SAM peptide maturase, CXXX-repeat target family [Muribaculaceae bacterium]
MNSARTITFIVTEACQLRCTYCYLVGKNDINKMPLDVATKAIDYVFSEPRLNSEESVVLDFIGGEPLLEIDLIQCIVEYSIAAATKIGHKWAENYRIRITTNGLLYSSPKIQQFILRYQNHLDMSISIDGTQKKHDTCRIFENGTGSYSAVVQSIPLWRKQFPLEGTKMTISHDDLPYVFESIRHLISLNITVIDVNTVLEDVWQNGDDEIFEQELIKCADYIIDNNLFHKVYLSCFDRSIGVPIESSDCHYNNPCGLFKLSVNYNGDFFTCLRFAQFSLRQKKARPIGNIRQGIDWNLMRPYQTFCNRISSKSCATCDIISGCKNCPAENYDSSDTGTIYQQSLSTCRMHHAKVRAKNYFWNKLSYNEPTQT